MTADYKSRIHHCSYHRYRCKFYVFPTISVMNEPPRLTIVRLDLRRCDNLQYSRFIDIMMLITQCSNSTSLGRWSAIVCFGCRFRTYSPAIKKRQTVIHVQSNALQTLVIYDHEQLRGRPICQDSRPSLVYGTWFLYLQSIDLIDLKSVLAINKSSAFILVELWNQTYSPPGQPSRQISQDPRPSFFLCSRMKGLVKPS